MAGIKHKATKVHGEKGLATEWNDDHTQDGNHDVDQNQFLNQVIENRTDFPAGPVEGQIIYRTDEKILYVYSDGEWANLMGIGFRDIVEDGTLITKGYGPLVENDTKTMYTVPVNTIAYITAATIHVETGAGSTGKALLHIGSQIGQVFDIRMGTATYQHKSEAVSFPVPLKLSAGETVKIYSSNVGCWVIATIIGYEVPV